MSMVTAKQGQILDLIGFRHAWRTRMLDELRVVARVEGPSGTLDLVGTLRVDHDTEGFYMVTGRKNTELEVRPNGDGRHVIVGEGHKALLLLRSTGGKHGKKAVL